MTSYRLNKRFWAMFESTSTWPNFAFGQLFTWIGIYNDHIWLPMGKTNNFEPYLNTDFSLIHFHFWSTIHMNWHIWWPHMTSYRLNKRFWAMFELTPTWPNFTFDELFTWIGIYNDHIWLLFAKQAILSNVWTDFNLIQFFFWSIFHMNWLI